MVSTSPTTDSRKRAIDQNLFDSDDDDWDVSARVKGSNERAVTCLPVAHSQLRIAIDEIDCETEHSSCGAKRPLSPHEHHLVMRQLALELFCDETTTESSDSEAGAGTAVLDTDYNAGTHETANQLCSPPRCEPQCAMATAVVTVSPPASSDPEELVLTIPLPPFFHTVFDWPNTGDLRATTPPHAAVVKRTVRAVALHCSTAWSACTWYTGLRAHQLAALTTEIMTWLATNVSSCTSDTGGTPERGTIVGSKRKQAELIRSAVVSPPLKKRVRFDLTASMHYKRWRAGRSNYFSVEAALQECPDHLTDGDTASTLSRFLDREGYPSHSVRTIARDDGCTKTCDGDAAASPDSLLVDRSHVNADIGCEPSTTVALVDECGFEEVFFGSTWSTAPTVNHSSSEEAPDCDEPYAFPLSGRVPECQQPRKLHAAVQRRITDVHGTPSCQASSDGPPALAPLTSILKKRTRDDSHSSSATAEECPDRAVGEVTPLVDSPAKKVKRVHFSPEVCFESKERTGIYRRLRQRLGGRTSCITSQVTIEAATVAASAVVTPSPDKKIGGSVDDDTAGIAVGPSVTLLVDEAAAEPYEAMQVVDGGVSLWEDYRWPSQNSSPSAIYRPERAYLPGYRGACWGGGNSGGGRKVCDVGDVGSETSTESDDSIELDISSPPATYRTDDASMDTASDTVSGLHADHTDDQIPPYCADQLPAEAHCSLEAPRVSLTPVTLQHRQRTPQRWLQRTGSDDDPENAADGGMEPCTLLMDISEEENDENYPTAKANSCAGEEGAVCLSPTSKRSLFCGPAEEAEDLFRDELYAT